MSAREAYSGYNAAVTSASAGAVTHNALVLPGVRYGRHRHARQRNGRPSLRIIMSRLVAARSIDAPGSAPSISA